MCGIAGVFHTDGSPVSLQLLQRMTAAVAHRGPDGEGHFADAGVGLGHRRLAIIDLSQAGRQPMGNEDGSVLIVYNGELYNYQKLRVELQAKGHHFQSRTDTEVVLHAYEEWGQDCLLRFNGHFAFAIWDGNRRKLFLARDRFGVKPLYYWFHDGRLLFGSEIKSILADARVPRRVSAEALGEYFTFQNILSDRTLFEGVRILPPGHSLTLAPNGEPVLEEYWDYQFPEQPLQISAEEAAEEVYRLFVNAVTRQLMSDVPVASYLSGGMDSGSITAVARQHLGRLMTFTCGFDMSSASGLELAFDERTTAEVMANLFKTEHYEVVLHAGDMEHVMPELIWHLEDLRVGQCYPNYYVARLAGKFAKVVLSGAGGDELFAGYPWRYYRGLTHGNQHQYIQNYYDFWQRLTPDEEKASLFSPQTYARLQQHSTFDVFRGVFGKREMPLETNEDCVNASLYFELKTFLHGLLVVEDKVSMAHSLETRLPFLDNDLVDFALKLPARHKLRNLNQLPQTVDEDQIGKKLLYEFQSGDGKTVLRSAMSRLIPPSVTERAKQGFSAPDASWFRGESIDYINQLLRDRRAMVYEFLNYGYVTRRLDQHVSGKTNSRLFIWSVLSLEWWLRNYFRDGQSGSLEH